jgi:hypothetical protein
MANDAEEIGKYLAAMDPGQRVQIQKIRALVRSAVPAAAEVWQMRMIAYTIGERPFAAVAAHKTTLSLYLMDFYTQPQLRERWEKKLAHLPMGKSCINFQTADQLPFDVVKAILAESPNFTVTGGTLAPKLEVTEEVEGVEVRRRGLKGGVRRVPLPEAPRQKPAAPEEEEFKIDAAMIAKAKAAMAAFSARPKKKKT